ncbi:MAG: hypothetical protein QG597_314 [Actinomycetota bacterium]|nr:hypothetical protein [Actinomycetota bacterium]
MGIAFGLAAVMLFIVTVYALWSERGSGGEVAFFVVTLAVLCSIGGLIVAAASGGA